MPYIIAIAVLILFYVTSRWPQTPQTTRFISLTAEEWKILANGGSVYPGNDTQIMISPPRR